MVIVRVIVNRLKVVIVDELIGNLDIEIVFDIMNIFICINECGIMIVMVTYNVDIVNIICYCVIVIEGGKIVWDEIEGGYGYEG